MKVQPQVPLFQKAKGLTGGGCPGRIFAESEELHLTGDVGLYAVPGISMRNLILEIADRLQG